MALLSQPEVLSPAGKHCGVPLKDRIPARPPPFPPHPGEKQENQSWSQLLGVAVEPRLAARMFPSP